MKLEQMAGPGHHVIQEDDEDALSASSISGLVSGMVVNVHGPSNKIISTSTYTDGQAGAWKENLAMQSGPTDAYGSILFDGSLSKAAKYIRLSPKSDMSKVGISLYSQRTVLPR